MLIRNREWITAPYFPIPHSLLPTAYCLPPMLEQIKKEICDIGDRIYKKGFATGNDGNISYRLSENEVVCTPTMISKGFMTPDDLCIVNMNGEQIAGKRKMTSEIKLHLTLMKELPEVKSVVHCHPPYATAFGIARELIPLGVMPEIEVQLGEVPIVHYAIPGSQELADTILPIAHKSRVCVLANHGTLSWGDTVEHAYWWTEMLDGYCRLLMLAHNLGNVGYFSRQDIRDLLELKKRWNVSDPRSSMEGIDIGDNDVFRDLWEKAGFGHRAFVPPKTQSNGFGNAVDLDAITDIIAEKVAKKLKDN